MPLSQSQCLEQLPFGNPTSFPFYNEMRPKRKLEMSVNCNEMESMDNLNEEMDGSLTSPKRLCFGRQQQSQTLITTEDTLPGCLKDIVASSQSKPNVEQQPKVITTTENLNTVDMEEDLTHQGPTDISQPTNADVVSDPGASMDTDFVPDTQQYNVSPSHNSSQNAYCGCVTCNLLPLNQQCPSPHKIVD